MQRTSLLEEIIKGFRDKVAIRCPFEETPPENAELLEVPQEVRKMLTIWQRLEEETAELLKVSNPRESRSWMWRKDEAGAVEMFARRHLQTKHNVTRAHQVEYYSDWKFRFVLSS